MKSSSFTYSNSVKNNDVSPSLKTDANNSVLSSPSSASSTGFGKPKQNTTTIIAEFLSNNNLYSSEDYARYIFDPILRFELKENPESVLAVPSVLPSLSINATSFCLHSDVSQMKEVVPDPSPILVVQPQFPTIKSCYPKSMCLPKILDFGDSSSARPSKIGEGRNRSSHRPLPKVMVRSKADKADHKRYEYSIKL